MEHEPYTHGMIQEKRLNYSERRQGLEGQNFEEENMGGS